jgi:hypothetical protein
VEKQPDEAANKKMTTEKIAASLGCFGAGFSGNDFKSGAV